MRRNTSLTFNIDIIDTIEEGLLKKPKALPSWLLYDRIGDALFQQIMHLPEYYPTRCEFEILDHYKEDLAKYFSEAEKTFQLIELGAGDAHKTEILLQYFQTKNIKLTYHPIDISASVLAQLQKRLNQSLPAIPIEGIQNDYFDALDHLSTDQKKVILFLGGNIGNYSPEKAKSFLSQLNKSMAWNDMVLIGFDLKKHPRIIEQAYNDASGVTRAFNLNLLQRINRELGADFNIDNFEHLPVYNPESGAARSYLVSLVDQTVHIDAMEQSFQFSQWETIFTEISQKYDLLSMERLLSSAHLEIVDLFFDSQHFFCNVLVKKSNIAR